MRYVVPLIVALALGGCVDANLKDPSERHYEAVHQARIVREKHMQDAWIGKSIDEVRATLGKPEMMMNIPGTMASSLMLYGMRDGYSRCIDAFRIAHGKEPTVTSYFCR